MDTDSHRFWLFGCERYYPRGGLKDFICSLADPEALIKESLDDPKSFMEKYGSFDDYQIVDAKRKIIIGEADCEKPCLRPNEPVVFEWFDPRNED